MNPERDGAGTRFVYSCNCGWIDWEHATPRGHALIDVVKNMQTKKWSWATIGQNHPVIPSTERKEIGGYTIYQAGTRGSIAVFTNLSDLEVYQVALGIFISKENLFERHQGGAFFQRRTTLEWFANRPPSIFAEEYLMSNLIGFHRGMHKRSLGWPDSITKKYVSKK